MALITPVVSNTSLASVFPAGAACFVGSLQAATPCNITDDMVSFLNVTDEFEAYFNAYCLNAPQDDGCPYGYCPNPDIAGVFVRLSTYMTNFFIAILVFYAPIELKDTFWAQLLNVYALLLTVGWEIIRHHLTRIHAILTTAIAGSPLTICIFLYALRSIWEGEHRLSPAIGRGKLFPRSIVLGALAVWISLLIYILLPSHLSDFQQQSCEQNNHVVKYFFFLPVLIIVDSPFVWQCLVLLPIALTALAWIVVIIIRRHQIWPRGQTWKPHFAALWAVIKDCYPFIQFISVIAIPTAYWIAAIEVGVLAAKTNDNHIAATFGQVLAMFVAIPPLIEVLKLSPRMWHWFTDLCWVRLITGRPQRVERFEPESDFSFIFSSPANTYSQQGGFGYDKKPMELVPATDSWSSNRRGSPLVQ